MDATLCIKQNYLIPTIKRKRICQLKEKMKRFFDILNKLNFSEKDNVYCLLAAVSV